MGYLLLFINATVIEDVLEGIMFIVALGGWSRGLVVAIVVVVVVKVISESVMWM